MMYQNKLVACLKVNGRILREDHGVVLVPFGSEYSIQVKNLNSVRAKVKIGVDGEDATGGTWLVIEPNSSTELERFIRNGNWQSGNRFKFIERSGDVEAHRGIKAEDGIVRVEYATERRVVDVPIVRHYDVPVPHYYNPPDPWYPRPPRRPYYGGLGQATRSMGTRSRGPHASADSDCRVETSCGMGSASASGGSGSASNFMNFSEQGATYTASASSGEAGITVAGSESHQAFHGVPDFSTDQSDVMVLMLRGIVGNQAVEAAVTIQTKRTCSTCGKTHKSDVAFCSGCGTALTLI